MKREEDFATFYERVITEINSYIETSNQQNKNGWQLQAAGFRDLTLRTVTQGSLLDLQFHILRFCNTLNSTFNVALSAVVGPFWTKRIGEKICAPGSILKDKLMAIAYAMQPLHAFYIINEIQYNKSHPQEARENYSYISLDAIGTYRENLSLEGQQVMEIIASDAQLTQQFLYQATTFAHDIDPKTLIELFKPNSAHLRFREF